MGLERARQVKRPLAAGALAPRCREVVGERREVRLAIAYRKNIVHPPGRRVQTRLLDGDGRRQTGGTREAEMLP